MCNTSVLPAGPLAGYADGYRERLTGRGTGRDR
jgi:hypothetical protein